MMRFLALLSAVVMMGLVGCGKDNGWKKVQNDDPQIVAARQQAKDTFPEFLKAFKNRKQGCFYTVEVKVEEGGQVEYLTLDVMKASDTEVTGVIVDHPSKVKLQSGATITAPISNLSDWRVELDDGTVKGGYVADVRAKLSRGG